MNAATNKALPYGRQTIEDDDIEAVVKALQGDFLTTGPIVNEFEDAFALEVSAKHAISINSGTSGLHIAMMALGVGPEDAVIVPTLTFMASANCVEYVGGEVVFADIDPDNGLMDINHIRTAFDNHKGKPIKGIILVHLNGQTTDLKAVKDFAQERGLFVMEDACHALGGSYHDNKGEKHPVGNSKFSDITMFSGHPVKTIAMGESGILTTNNDKYAEKLKLFRSHHMEKNPDNFVNQSMGFDENGDANIWYHEMQTVGYNFRCSDIHCALGLSQIKKLKTFVNKRQNLVNLYLENISDLEPNINPITHTNHGNYGWHLFPVLCNFEKIGMSRNALMKALATEKIFTQVHYIPVSEQPYYKNKFPDVQVPGAMKYYERILSLPLYPLMEPEDALRVIQTIKRIIGN